MSSFLTFPSPAMFLKVAENFKTFLLKLFRCVIGTDRVVIFLCHRIHSFEQIKVWELATSHRFFVTFKGKFYMEGGGFSRWPLLQLQTMNSPQVIIDVQCHVHSKRQRNLPAFAKEKQQLQLPGAHEYQLCIEDNQRATGFAEVMSAGCFPAFITSEWVCLPIWRWHWFEFNFYFFWAWHGWQDYGEIILIHLRPSSRNAETSDTNLK